MGSDGLMLLIDGQAINKITKIEVTNIVTQFQGKAMAYSGFLYWINHYNDSKKGPGDIWNSTCSKESIKTDGFALMA